MTIAFLIGAMFGPALAQVFLYYLGSLSKGYDFERHDRHIRAVKLAEFRAQLREQQENQNS